MIDQTEIEEQYRKRYPSIDQSQLGHTFMQAERKAFERGALWAINTLQEQLSKELPLTYSNGEIKPAADGK